jgi:uncharacterized delta-60 repeat protein
MEGDVKKDHAKSQKGHPRLGYAAAMLTRYCQFVRRLTLLVLSVLVVLAVGCGGKSGTNKKPPGPVTSWGENGTVKLPGFTVSRILQDHSGRVLVLGISAHGLARAQVVRLLPDGSLDSSFGKGGIVRWPYERFLGWIMGAVLPDGKILLAGATRFGVIDTQSSLVLAELDQDGRIVQSFGRHGSYVTGKASCLRGPTGIAAQGGRAVVAVVHQCTFDSPQAVVLMRFQTDGTLDNSFGQDGSVFLSRVPEYFEPSTPIISLPNNHLAVAAPVGKRGRVAVFGLLNNGARDSRFGRSGVASARVAVDSYSDSTYGLFRSDKGSLTIGGCTFNGTFLVRFKRTGRPDKFWGSLDAETNVEQFGGAFGAPCASLAQLPHDVIVAAGTALVYLDQSGILNPYHPITLLPDFNPSSLGPAHYPLAARDGTLFVTSTVGKSSLIGRYR